MSDIDLENLEEDKDLESDTDDELDDWENEEYDEFDKVDAMIDDKYIDDEDDFSCNEITDEE